MSRTTLALIFKFVMTVVFAAGAFILIDGNGWTWPIVVGVAGTILNYVLGDLVVLPRFGNIAASIGDGVLAALTAYVVDLIVPAFTTSATSLAVFAVLIAVGEYFFHQYLKASDRVAP